MADDRRRDGGSPGERGSTGFLVAICLVAALGGLLFGYDTAVISGAIEFIEKYLGLDATAKGWASASALLGCAAGAALAGLLSDALGRKKVLVLAALCFLVSAVGAALPESLAALVVFRIIGGLGIGAASMTSPMYIAEVTPARIRGRMVSVNQFAIVSGMLIVYFVNYFIAHHVAGAAAPEAAEAWNTQTGWRWMFASGALPAILLLACLFFVPESPRWLTAAGREDRAVQVLARINGSTRAGEEMREIKAALAQEGGRLAELLQPGMKLVLVVGVALAVLQQVTGINVFLYYAPEIFKNLVAGTKDDAALLQTVVVGVVNISFTVVAIWTVDRLGRRPLMMAGAAGMGVSLAALGAAAYLDRTEGWVLVFILGYIASFALSVGPVTWVILAEIFPTRIRGRAMAIATVCLWLANYAVSQTFPMMDKNEWLAATFNHAFPFWLYGVFCIALILVVRFAVPETKGRSLEEIERMWRPRP
ncbi:MAG TPA: hypothetical protein DCM87_08465 [Planctomycetes bacterium]|nr:hypothetical protein [Planctomycetota bacterium]